MLTFSTVRRRFPEARVLSGKNGTEFAVHCPSFHRKGGRFKLNINAETGAYYCQDCGDKGNAVKEWFDEVEDQFAHLRIRRDAEEASILEARSRPREGVFARQGGEVWENNVPSPGRLVPFNDLADIHPAVAYLAGRGHDIAEIRDLEPGMALHYCTKGIPIAGGNTSGRIIFPIYMDGVLKGWQARRVERITGEGGDAVKHVWNDEGWQEVPWSKRRNAWADKDIPKYLTCPGMARGDVLYGYDQAKKGRTSDNKLVVIAEGPLDQLMVGYPCVGTLGGFSAHQIRLIVSYFETAVILRDPNINPSNEKAWKTFQRVLDDLSPIKSCHLALSSGSDPGGTPRKEIWADIVREMNLRSYEIPLNCQRN